MEWTDDRILELIEEYKARPVLWDPNSVDYKLLNKKNDSWKSLAAVMKTDVGEVKKKINSLLASFRRERSREKRMSSMGANEVYKSTWFAYNPMTFLMDKFKVKDSMSSEYIVQNNEEEIVVDDIDTYLTESEDVQENEVSIKLENPYQSTSSGSYFKRKVNRPIKNRSKIKKVDAQSKDVVVIIKTVGNNMDESKPEAHKSTDDAFGEYIASKMRGYSHNTKCFVQNKINNILFEADMGMFDQPGHTDPE